MRWSAFLLMSPACFAGYGGPLPEIKVGTTHREIVIAETPWYAGQFSISQAFLVGTVMDVSAEVQTKPQQIWLSESCTVRVDAAFGHLNQIEGVEIAKLQSGSEHSPYVPVDDDWGQLRHLKKGQKILVLLHSYEGELCFGSKALIVLRDDMNALPEMLRRTAFNSIEFSDEELMTLKTAWPFLHDQILEETAAERNMYAEESRLRRQAMKSIAGWAGLTALVIFVAYRLLRKRMATRSNQ
ncbi:MAG: hypothetical protein ACKVY0_23075 [Prosthecobacter sp.]|uniref:hypothetical protein n=1 Tax=Prosthecobacter sp. TaxID=1965333 RepID=UPI0038FEDD99